MSENNSNRNVNNDEIDLLDLFRRIGNTLSKWFKALGKAFLISVVFLVRRWLPLGLSVVVGLIVSIILRNSTDSTFTSDLVLRNNAVPTSDMISFVNNLHSYFKDKNLPALSASLNLDEATMSNVGDVEAFWIIDKSRDGIPDYVDYDNAHNIYDTINVRMKDRFDIRVSIKTPQELVSLKNGILKYIESDSIFQKQNRLRLRHNNEMLVRLEYDITQLDSLQKMLINDTKSRIPQNGSQMVFLQDQKTQLLYPDVYTLYSRKQSLESSIAIYNGIVTVLSDFSIPSRRVNGGLYYAKKIVPVLFGLTLLVLVLLANRKKLGDIYKQY